MKNTLRSMRAKRAAGDSGFTLIELLVVVVIIGVLVAIAIPVYLNYREGAADKSAQSDARGAITAVEQYYTVNANKYPTGPTGEQTANFTLTPAGTSPQTVAVSAGTKLKYVTKTSSYVICAWNTGGNEVYKYDSTVGGSVKATGTKGQTGFNSCG